MARVRRYVATLRRPILKVASWVGLTAGDGAGLMFSDGTGWRA